MWTKTRVFRSSTTFAPSRLCYSSKTGNFATKSPASRVKKIYLTGLGHWDNPKSEIGSAPGAARTRNLRLRRPSLYPVELRAQELSRKLATDYTDFHRSKQSDD